MDCRLSLGGAAAILHLLTPNSILSGLGCAFVPILTFCMWAGHRVLDITGGIKNFYYLYTHPKEAMAGFAISVCPGNELFYIAARIVCVVRPYIYLSKAGDEVKKNAKGIFTRIFGDENVAYAFEKGRGTVHKFSKYLITDRCAMFSRRLKNGFINLIWAAVYSCDVLEALTAHKEDLLIRCLPELHEAIKNIGKEDIIKAIDANAPWINRLLHTYSSHLDVNTIKGIIVGAADYTEQTKDAFEEAVNIIAQGILTEGG